MDVRAHIIIERKIVAAPGICAVSSSKKKKEKSK
jgi:hypothetical protein